MKFGKQLALIFIAATAIPMIISWFVSGELLYRKELQDVRSRHLLIAKNIAGALERYYHDLDTSFSLVVKNLAAGNKVEHADNLIKNFHFRHFCIADAQNGKVIAEVSPQNARCPKQVPAKRFAMFKKMARPDVTSFSPVLMGPGKKPMIYLVQKQGNKLAIAGIYTDYMIRLAKAIAFGKRGHAAIVDQKGNVLAHPNPNWIKSRKNIAKISIIKSMLAGKTGVEQFYSPAMKADMIAGYSAVPAAGWAVMVPQPLSELRINAAFAQRSFFSFLALGIVIAGLAATFVAQRFLSSVKNVIAGAEKVAKGDSDVRVKVDKGWHVPHELQNLQEQFNTMTQAVAEHQDKITQKLKAENAENKSKSEYFANLAHEFKTPLNSIIGFSSVLRSSKPGTLKPHETTEFLGHIEKSANHLLSFVNDLMDYNRLEMGAQKLEEKEFSLLDPVRFCEATLRRQIADKKITLHISSDDNGLKVRADERAMNQILINLVSNAVRYSFENGQISVNIAMLDGGDVKISVHDRGIGIPEADLADITLPFKRANDPEIAEIHGTGLGLSIVNKLAQLQQFEFAIESVHGFSTTASLVIPADRVVAKEKKTDKAA